MTDKQDKHNQQRTEISSLGEFGLIKHLTQHFPLKNSSTIKGVGDDAAVIDPAFQLSVITTDMLIESIHFDMMYTPLKHLGYKAVVANLSDVFAMNAVPEQILVSIAVSNRFSVEAIEELYAGIKLACEKYQIDLAGGDTTSSPKGLCISVTAIGKATAEEIVYRSGAGVNDLICVSGNLGAAYLGLQLLEREKQVYLENPEMQPELDEYAYLIERQLKPETRPDIIKRLKELGVVPTAMIDVSDGLSSDLLHICDASGKGCRIYEDHIPVHTDAIKAASMFQMSPVTAALNGGEDYELLFTINQNDFEKIKKVSDVFMIGHITEEHEKHILVSESGSHYPLTAQGWNPLKGNSKNN